MRSTKRIVGIASVPQRKESLLTVVASIKDQVDEIFIALNGYPSVPEELHEVRNAKYAIFDNSQMDLMKFYVAGDVDGYFFGLDDDLRVSEGYVDYLQRGVGAYHGVVSLHGRYYQPPVTHFKRWSRNYRCLNAVEHDAMVNFIGSGCCAFHTDSLKVDIRDFKYPGMADCYLSRLAFTQGVPMFVLKHRIGQYLEYIPPLKGTTLWETNKDYTHQTEILKSYLG